jgi:putative phosphoribosyl transferase
MIEPVPRPFIFDDRRHAGAELAARLGQLETRRGAVVLALPRGGVPVAYEVAVRLGAPLDVFLVRKLGVPGYPELAMGAIASGGVRVLNDAIVSMYDVPPALIERVALEEEVELERRERRYRPHRDAVELADRTAILVDDGLATGATMKAAVTGVRARRPAAVVVAVPVGAADSCRELADEADEVVCLHTPDEFTAVGQWYRDFAQTGDDEVRDLLDKAPGAHR